VTGRNVIGLEGAMWGETIATMADADYMVFPRLFALAEVAWSPHATEPRRARPTTGSCGASPPRNPPQVA
jgi:N-acetyl-beta-hexosaminidase